MFERSSRQRPPEDMVLESARKLERNHPGAARLITAGYAPERDNESVLSDVLRALLDARQLRQH